MSWSKHTLCEGQKIYSLRVSLRDSMSFYMLFNMYLLPVTPLCNLLSMPRTKVYHHRFIAANVAKNVIIKIKRQLTIHDEINDVSGKTICHKKIKTFLLFNNYDLIFV